MRYGVVLLDHVFTKDYIFTSQIQQEAWLLHYLAVCYMDSQLLVVHPYVIWVVLLTGSLASPLLEVCYIDSKPIGAHHYIIWVVLLDIVVIKDHIFLVHIQQEICLPHYLGSTIWILNCRSNADAIQSILWGDLKATSFPHDRNFRISRGKII